MLWYVVAWTGYHAPAEKKRKVIAMRVWLYSRLSRDEDSELNSLTNQQNILREYAANNNCTVIGESADDNISGMHFNREGINKIYAAVENKSIDAVIVKDLSRLGRHRTQTAMFIDYLRENDVRVLSVTENIDTSNEDDDLMVGFKGIFNDMYARDISKKIRAGYKQKQKSGIVMIPPLGYFKDKNTGKVTVVEEHAEIVRKIFNLYVSGYGLKAISKILNEEGIKSPGYYQKKLLGKNLGYNKPEIAHRFLWENTGVKRILQNEFYIGNLICHKSYTSKINHIRKELPPEEHFKHENAVPAIIPKEIWEQAQFLLEQKPKRNVRASSGNTHHRYTGLIKCGDCGSSFSCKTRYWRNNPPRMEYVCNGYHRYGKENCSPHKIGEEVLDRLILKELEELKIMAHENFKRVDKELKKWLADRPSAEKQITALKEKLAQRKTDQQQILLERIRDREHAEVYTKMLVSCETDIKTIENRIREMKDIENTVKERKKQMKKSVELLDGIIADGAISDTHLRMLVDEIVIYEKNGKLDIQITLNGEFRTHIDYYDESGDITDRHAEIWYFPNWESMAEG